MDSHSPLIIPYPQCSAANEPCKVLDELEQLRKEVDLLKEQVRTDALTGLYNYRFFSDTLPMEMERTRRSAQPLSLMILDIDHFKQFNDQWGHELGNHALTHIARLISQTVRKLDYACRFGGEEFVIILPNTDIRHARNVAERLREIIATTPVMTTNSVSISISASLGVDEFRASHSDSVEGFIGRVDAWLYGAKHSGRNCVGGPPFEATPVSTTLTLQEKDALYRGFDNDE